MHAFAFRLHRRGSEMLAETNVRNWDCDPTTVTGRYLQTHSVGVNAAVPAPLRILSMTGTSSPCLPPSAHWATHRRFASARSEPK